MEPDIKQHLHYLTAQFREQQKTPAKSGLHALFIGSNQQTTEAVESIAQELNLPLRRIELSAVVGKYIGETEKNLEILFADAEESGAVLFFDEADALFSKRTEMKDSHDRYADIEVTYLLQRMEQYGGLAILATNGEVDDHIREAFAAHLKFPAIGDTRRIA